MIMDDNRVAKQSNQPIEAFNRFAPPRAPDVHVYQTAPKVRLQSSVCHLGQFPPRRDTPNGVRVCVCVCVCVCLCAGMVWAWFGHVLRIINL